MPGSHEPPPLTPHPPHPADRGDVSCHGFWRRGTTTIFDIRITDCSAPSNRNTEPKKVLAHQEGQKKKHYLKACLERRCHFTPLVFLVDGMQRAEATAASKRLSTLLSANWHRTYSAICGYVTARLSLALARSILLCLRGARDGAAKIHAPTWESGEGL